MSKKNILSQRFITHNNTLTIKPYYRFDYNGNTMLLCRENGATLFITSSIADDIDEGRVNDAISRKLFANGFIQDNRMLSCDDSCEILPQFFLIDLTNKCNMACAYCLRAPKEKQTSISYIQLDCICEYIANYCKDHQLTRFTIQPWGGEPLLEIDKIVHIRKFFENTEFFVDISVETNGTLLSDENIAKLRDNKINLSISVDGPPDIHDSQRMDFVGSPTSERIIRGIERLNEAGYDHLSGICVLTNNSIGRIADILQYAEQVLGMSCIKLNLMHEPIHDCKGVVAPAPDEIQIMAKEIIAELIYNRQQGGHIIELNVNDRLYNLIRGGNGNICHSCGCCGGRRMVSFDMNGGIYPCELTDFHDECMGNVAENQDLVNLIKEAIKIKPYFKAKEDVRCESCPWWYYCRGGCTAAVKYIRQSIDGIDEGECALNRALYPELITLLLKKDDTVLEWMM